MAARSQDPGPRSGHQRLVPRKGRPAPARPAPLPDPRAAVAARRRAGPSPAVAAAGRRAAVALVVVGALWIVLTEVGRIYAWPERTRALVDLFALAGFGFALYLTWQVWRLRRADKG